MTITDLLYIDYALGQNILARTHTSKSSYSRNEIATEIGFNAKSLAIPHQTHSTNVIFVNSSGEYENCDGLISQDSKLVLTLQTADCIPVFLYDESTGLRGLIHAGWRGVVGRIVVNAIELMVKHQSKVEDVRVVLGPAICKNCFVVGAEVAQRFENENKKKGEGDKWFANLHGEIICQLSNVGIVSSNIKTSNVCTFENENCCSYRRDGEKTGRMYSFLGVKNGFH